MKICIDALAVTHLHGTGLYSYTYELLDNLFTMYPQAEYELIWDKNIPAGKWERNKGVTYADLQLNRKSMDCSRLEEHIKENDIQLFHSPNNGFSIPLRQHCKTIATIHDLSPIACSEFADKKYSGKFLAAMDRVVEKADAIIAVSGFIKEGLLRYYPVDENKIKVIYPSCSNKFFPMDRKSCKMRIEEKYGVKGGFILYAGSIHPRKNLHIVLDAFKGILKYNRDIKLVIAGCNTGKREEYSRHLEKQVRSLNMENSVIFTGMADYTDMPFLYNASKCTINLSSYDGYPMAAVESLKCNTPAVCSCIQSFREVLRHEDFLVFPEQVNYIRDLVLEIINNEYYSAATTQKYRGQIEAISPEGSASKLVSLYESTVYGP